MTAAPSAVACPPAARCPGPALRLVHHMARSGGTVISKCLASMESVLLLSEIHPLGLRQFNPIAQAQQWFELFDAADLEALTRAGRIEFADGIALIEARARERGRHLVIRDWTHLDFTGVPFTSPAYRLRLADALRGRFRLRQVCTVRHPIDQWLSLVRLPVMEGRLELGSFLLGYRRFAEEAKRIGFWRYEDFTREPALVLADLCCSLELPFDPGFALRWRAYDRITGDVQGSRGGHAIGPVPRRPVEPALLDAFAANADYRQALDLLGYGHPQ